MSAVADADIQAVVCPDCKAAKGQPCVYLWPKGLDPDFVHYASAKQQAKAARVGKVTLRPHNGRYNRAHDVLQRRLRRQGGPTFLRATAQRLAAARAEAEFDRREYERLREWLRRNAGIFDTPTVEVTGEQRAGQPVERQHGV